MYKNEYLPTKCWFEDGVLKRAYFVHDEDCWDTPRNWDNLSIIVNAGYRHYDIGGRKDEKTDDIEEWLINATGINEDWYWANKERYGGIEGLIEKFRKEKCAAFQYLSVYDHSSITVFCGYARGWDYSAIGFAYIPKDNEEVKSYRKTHSKKETDEWAEKMIKGEIHILDQYVRGEVYGCVIDTYNEEEEDWEEHTDSCWGYYLNDETCESEEKDAIEIIKEFSGHDTKLYDMEEIETAIENGTLDVLNGQILLFKEMA